MLLGEKLLCFLLLHLLAQVIVVLILGLLFDLRLVYCWLNWCICIASPHCYHIAVLVAHRSASAALAKLAEEAIVVGVGALVHLMNIVAPLRRAENVMSRRADLARWLLLRLLLHGWRDPSPLSFYHGDAGEACDL